MIDKKRTDKIIFFCFTFIIIASHQIIFLDYLNFGKYHFDFQSTLSRLTFGKIWFFKNGLSVPWFTPHICCGLPFIRTLNLIFILLLNYCLLSLNQSHHLKFSFLFTL